MTDPEDESAATRQLAVLFELEPGDRTAAWFAEAVEEAQALVDHIDRLKKAGDNFHETNRILGGITTEANVRQYAAALLNFADQLAAIKAKIKQLRSRG